jgi:hypothetical protein
VSDRREQCRVGYCHAWPNAASLGHFCSHHWRKLPQDLRERVRWAKDEDDIDLEAALDAALDNLS